MLQQNVKRRTILAFVGSGILAGCVDQSDSDTTGSNQRDLNSTGSTEDLHQSDNNTENTTSSNMGEDNAVVLRDVDLERHSRCFDTRVEFGTDTITIMGCVTGSNGCHVPAIKETDVSDKMTRIVIESREDRAANEVCTDAVVKNGYEATLYFLEELPESITVIHDDMNGRQAVLSAQQ